VEGDSFLHKSSDLPNPGPLDCEIQRIQRDKVGVSGRGIFWFSETHDFQILSPLPLSQVPVPQVWERHLLSACSFLVHPGDISSSLTTQSTALANVIGNRWGPWGWEGTCLGRQQLRSNPRPACQSLHLKEKHYCWDFLAPEAEAANPGKWGGHVLTLDPPFIISLPSHQFSSSAWIWKFLSVPLPPGPIGAFFPLVRKMHWLWLSAALLGSLCPVEWHQHFSVVWAENEGASEWEGWRSRVGIS
jgi:hypothetical protein